MESPWTQGIYTIKFVLWKDHCGWEMDGELVLGVPGAKVEIMNQLEMSVWVMDVYHLEDGKTDIFGGGTNQK